MIRIVVASVLLVSSLARAESLEERKYWRGQMAMLDSDLREANEECEVEITFEYIDKAEMRAAAEKGKFSPRVVCNPLIKEIARTCRDGDKRKAAVAKKAKTLQCGYSTNKTLTVKGGVVRMKATFEVTQRTNWVPDQLKAKI